MAETSGVSGRRYVWALVVVLLIGGGLFLARPFLEGTPSGEDPVEVAVATEPPVADAPEPASEAPTEAAADGADPEDEPVAAEPETAEAREAPEEPETTAALDAPEAPEPAETTGAAGDSTEIAEDPTPPVEAPAEPIEEAAAPPADDGTDAPGDVQIAEEAPPTADAATEEAATDPVEVPEPAAPAPTVPSFDVVRVAPDGEALVAGNAAPGSPVRVLVDGVVAGETSADASGQFVLLFSLGLSEAARVVSLATDGAEGDVLSDQEIIVAPMPRPVAVAEAAPAPQTDPTEDVVDDTAAASVAADLDRPDEPDTAAAEDGPALAESEAQTVAEAPAATTSEEPAPEPAGAETAPDRVAADPVAGAEPPGESSAPTLLLSEGGTVRVIQSESPEVLDRVAIDAITYDVEGDVTLTGRAEGDGFVRVYIDNRPILTAEIGAGGNWRTELPEVDTGVYTLRVDALDAEGNVTSRAETPFLREPAEAVQTIAQDLRTNVLGDIVTVQPGDHLWGIATRRYGEGILYVKVFEANKNQIRDPDLIYPGQIFALPE